MLALIALAAAAATTPPPAPPPPPAKVDCNDAAHRALDFWVGDWTVSDRKSGMAIAESRIDKIEDGCALRENFTQHLGPGGKPFAYHGTSYTALNLGDGKWRQLYVDTQGGAMSFIGGPEGPAMVLVARAGPLGTRMTIAPEPDGAVRQSGEVTKDDGATWTPGYDLLYRRK